VLLIDPHSRWLEVSHCAHRIGFSQGFIRKLIRTGKLPATMFETRWRVKERDLEAYIERCQAQIALRESAIDELLSTARGQVREARARIEKTTGVTG
jgi:excisionase family DNA binding protein